MQMSVAVTDHSEIRGYSVVCDLCRLSNRTNIISIICALVARMTMKPNCNHRLQSTLLSVRWFDKSEQGVVSPKLEVNPPAQLLGGMLTFCE